MADFRIPYGAEFSPDKINIKEVLQMILASEGKTTEKFVSKIAEKYFKNNYSMANNCKTSMVAYEILQKGGGINLSLFGKELVSMSKETEIYDAMAKHILTRLNGLMFIEAIRAIKQEGNRPTLEKLTETINIMGCKKLPKTNKYIATMKKWLEKADVLNGWEIRERKLENLIGMQDEDVERLRGLNHVQICFIKALCNTGIDDEYQSATKIRELAKVTYNVKFPEKNFANAIIKPLVEKKLIEKKPSAEKHGGNASEIKLVVNVRTEVLSHILGQMELIVGKEVIQYCQKSLKALRVEVDSSDTYVKGLALEAFAIKMMQIIDLNFIGTRVKGSETGGAEVDVLFDTTRLNYS